jgi:hypothetical protein
LRVENKGRKGKEKEGERRGLNSKISNIIPHNELSILDHT